MTSSYGVLRNRTTRTIALIELLVLTVGVSTPCLPQENPNLNTYFRTHIGLSEMQIQAVRSGKGFAKTLPSRVDGEIFLFGAIHIDSSTETYVNFWRVTELITTLIEAHEDRQLMRLRSRLSKLDLPVLDELGYVPASKVGAELLFDVISTAYERTSIVVTTNLPFENWTEVLGIRTADGRRAGPIDSSLSYH